MYKVEAANSIDTSVATYWKQFGHFKDGGHMDTCIRKHADTMCVFPGRKLLRPPFKTDGKDKMDCTKKYFKSRPNVTSSISLHCPFEHRKITEFTLIKEVESLAMAISTLFAFLRFPPRTIWYDNDCNTTLRYYACRTYYELFT